MPVAGRVVEIAALTKGQRDRMFEIISAYFDGATRRVFDRDLDEKHWAVVLSDANSGRLCGFSTLKLIEEEVAGTTIRAFFSGDTIIQRGYWASMALERAWIRFTFAHALQDPEVRYFWFLVVNSYRSFRYLPVYTKAYYPNPDYEMPAFERAVLDRLASQRYGEEYDAVRGVVRMEGGWRLRPGVADIGEPELRDPRIAFFQQRNPAWREGVELACLTEFSPDNVNRFARRILEGLSVPR